MLDAARAVFLVQMKYDLGVHRRTKLLALADAPRAMFVGVVTLAVLCDPDAGMFIGHGHAPAFAEIHERRVLVRTQPPKSCTAVLSGPRWRMAAAIFSVAEAYSGFGSVEAIPAMPHMFRLTFAQN